MHFEIVVRIAAAFFYWISSVTFVGDFTKKLLNRICLNIHRILRLIMLICQTEFIIRAILTQCGGIFDEIHGLKMTLKYAQYIHDAEIEKFILTCMCQFGGRRISNSATLQFCCSSRKE